MKIPPHPRSPEALPRDPLGQRLCQIFPYRWAAIVRPNQPDGSWETLTKHAIGQRELWLRHQDAEQIVGVRFDSTTTYGLLDLDVNGIYHPNQDADALPLIRASLETIGIVRTFLIESSSSNGLHLWLPLPEPVSTFWLAAAIKRCLEAQGFVTRQGWLEIFPNCKAYARPGEFTEYQGHRLPLQPQTGSRILDDDLNPIAGGLDRFFELWDQCAAGQDIDLLHQAIDQAKKQKSQFTRRNASNVDAWRTALEFEISEGWTGHGQTNHLLKQIACYGVVFLKLQNQALIEYVQRTAVGCSGYERWCRHQHEIAMRCKVWAREAEGYYWPLGTEGSRRGNIHKLEGANAIVPLHRVNEARSQDAQARIGAAYEQLKAEGRLPEGKTARENAIVELAGCSKQTTRKYLHLWYPDRDDLDRQVCTPDPEPTSAEFDSVSAEPQKSPEPLPDNEVHTTPYMKGDPPCTETAPNFPQLRLPFANIAKSSAVHTRANCSPQEFCLKASVATEQLPLSPTSISTSAIEVNFVQLNLTGQTHSFDDLVPDG